MGKAVAAIELCSKAIKVVVGYVIDGRVQVLYTLTKPVGKVIDKGGICDIATIKSELEKLNVISDDSAKLKINISNVLVALPPYGLHTYQIKPLTTVMSDQGKVDTLDIRNAYTQVHNTALPAGTKLVDIVPVQYVLDNGRRFANAPIGETSSSLQMIANVHVLPEHIYNDYTKIIEDSGISIKRTFVSSVAASEILSTYEEIPQEYLLVDIGSDVTTISLIGNKQIFASIFFSWGGDVITRHIVEQFNVDDVEAEKFKILYGLDERKLSFDPNVSTSQDDEGNEVKHNLSELTELIKNDIDSFLQHFDSALSTMIPKESADAYKNLPIVFIGGASSLFGFKEYVASKIPARTIIVSTPKVLGARNSTYYNCLGMILMNSKYPSTYDESAQKVNGLGREPLEGEK